MSRIRTLIHVHTNYSFDAATTPEQLLTACRAEGIDCVTVTDHDTIDGARRVAELAAVVAPEVRVIIGEEITTRHGHLIGLFTDRHIPPGMSARDTAIAIREQGGLVFVPHPFTKWFGCGLGRYIWDIVDVSHAVEVNNAQNLTASADRDAERFARCTDLVPFVGADSHLPGSVAPCYQEMDDFSGPDDFLASLKSAELTWGRHPLWYFSTMIMNVGRYHLGLPLPDHVGINAAGDAAGAAA